MTVHSDSDSPRRAPLAAQLPADRVVLVSSAAIAVAFVVWGIVDNKGLAEITGSALDWVIRSFGWIFILASTGFVILTVFLACSRFGRIRLGRDDERPEFRTVSWVAMMFSAGMGIGLMFYGVAEPLSHLSSPPLGLAQANTQDAARLAMEYSYFHWAFHPWAMYAIVGLALAYFGFRQGRANLISSAFFPLLGRRSEGGMGRAIDTFAIFATLFGSATSLGLGALQINSGLNQLYEVPKSTPVAVGIIVALTIAFIVSAASGVHRGIQYLSNTNMVLAVLLLFFLFVVGPSVFVLSIFTESVGGYLYQLAPMSFRAGAFGGEDWLQGWTIFYWAWWVSWTPFVGTFIARISRGRTIRQFVLGVVLAPSLVSFVWFAILGGISINLQLGGVDLSSALATGQETALFELLRQYPAFTITALVVVILVALFFISGADAAALVMGILSCRGCKDPRVLVTVFWGSMTGAVAAILLVAGGLDALQTLCILAAFPFLFVMVGVAVSLVKELRHEAGPRQNAPPDLVKDPLRAAPAMDANGVKEAHTGDTRARLKASQRRTP